MRAASARPLLTANCEDLEAAHGYVAFGPLGEGHARRRKTDRREHEHVETRRRSGLFEIPRSTSCWSWLRTTIATEAAVCSRTRWLAGFTRGSKIRRRPRRIVGVDAAAASARSGGDLFFASSSCSSSPDAMPILRMVSRRPRSRRGDELFIFGPSLRSRVACGPRRAHLPLLIPDGRSRPRRRQVS